jgi:hypothetical protein
MIVFALLGSKALYLTYIWLASAIAASWLSERKGYGAKPGLASGLILTFVGLIIWIVWPSRSDSKWKLQGPIPRRGAQTVASLRAQEGDAGKGPSKP